MKTEKEFLNQKMQIVIDIDEKRFRDIQRISTVQLKKRTPTLEQVIANGTLLPEGHGRLIDAEDVKNNHEKWLGYLDEDMIARLNIAVDNHIPTIIEADKEGGGDA